MSVNNNGGNDSGIAVLDTVIVTPDSDWVRSEHVTLRIYSAEMRRFYDEVERDIANRTARAIAWEFGGKPILFALGGMYVGAVMADILYLNEGIALASTVGIRGAEAGASAARGAGQLLYRYRNGAETATRLARGAADAEAKIGVHGVSVTTNPVTGRACGVACRDAVERVFPVVKTGADPSHFTVVLPKPVTKEVAEQFNQLFRDVP
jgi:hypothetical protein